MTSRFNESSGSNCYTPENERTNFASINVQPEEGCPVINEYGTVCGETQTLTIFQEFRQVYDDCIQKMGCIKDDSSTLKKLAPFKKLMEDLWEQNTMLIETVEEIEQEATNRVEMLQNKLDQCCEKVDEYIKDIKSLVEIIRRFREKGILDISGLKFNTICDLEIYGCCTDSYNVAEEGKSEEKIFHENSRDSKYSRREISLRDSSTSTLEIYLVTKTTTNTIKNNSCQSDHVISISQRYELNSELLDKNPSKNVKNINFNDSVSSDMDAQNDHYSIGKNYKTVLGKETSDKIKNNTCKIFDKNLITPLSGFQNSMKTEHQMRLEERDKNFSSFRSPINCTEEKNIANRTTDNNSKFSIANLKSKDRTRNTTSKEMSSNGIYTNSHSENFMMTQNKYRCACFDFRKSININLNLIPESACLESDFEKCDCDCNICGSFRDI